MADATIENLFNFYRDANGQLLNFEYKGQIFDYVYNQRGDIVAITDELQEVIARYTYDEWGNLEKIDAPTEVGAEIAQANPYRYVGKFGVQYDQDTNLYFMGWRDYDSKIGRFIVADEYEGDDNNPISFNRYLYAEADPVNNIDPDGYLPKWLKKLSKGVKKTAKAAYNFAIGDDINTLKSKKTKWYQKAGAAVSIASNFIPGGGIVTKAAKAIFKGTRKAVKTYKASRAVSKATRVVRSKSKRVAAKVNKRPKTVHASSIRSTPKGQSSAASKVTHSTPKPKPKATVAPKPARAAKPTRVEKLQGLAKGTGETTSYYRVQGGEMPNASQVRMQVDKNGKMVIPNKDANLNVSAGTREHAEYFLQKRGNGAEIVEVEVPRWFDHFVKENAIPQYKYNSNPRNQGGAAPKVVDPSTPGTSYEFPAPWIEWLEEYGKIKK